MKRIKKDNKGFTLVELIIAVVIVAIVMTPFIRNFTESTRLNSKAKDAMDATNMASNIMEGLNAYTAEEIILAFNSVDARGELAILPNEVTNVGYGEINTTGAVWEKGFSVAGADPTAEVDYSNSNYAVPLSGASDVAPNIDNLELKPSSDKKYYFYVEGVEQRRGTYDIAVVLDASSTSGYSGTDEDKNGVLDEYEKRYNDYDSAKLTSINGLFDRIYQENANMRDGILVDFYNEQTNQWNKLSTEQLESVLSRTMTIDIKYKTGTTDVIVVEGTESFSLPWNGVSVAGSWIDVSQYYSGNTHGWSASNLPTLSEPTTLIFDSSEYNQMPRNIYIYYYANYASDSSDYLDKFVINNTADIDINIHLIRIASDETTTGLETSYASKLYLNEDVSNGINTRITSNLRDDITKSNADNATNRTIRTRCPFYLNGMDVYDTDEEYITAVNENGGVETEVKDRLYSLTMYVYEEGAAASGFPEDMLVTTFEGSANQ